MQQKTFLNVRSVSSFVVSRFLYSGERYMKQKLNILLDVGAGIQKCFSLFTLTTSKNLRHRFLSEYQQHVHRVAHEISTLNN